MTDGDNSLMKSCIKHEDYFKQLIELVPDEFYNDPKDTDEESSDEAVQKKNSETNQSSNSTPRGDGKKKKKKKKKKNLTEDDSEGELKTRTARLEELRERLNKKIEEMEANRKNDKDGNRSIVTLNRQKKKLNKKIKIEKCKIQKGANKTGNMGKSSELHNAARTKHTGIFNKEGKMVFSKFDFKDTVKQRPKKKGNRNVEKVLNKIKKDKEKLAEMKEKDPEKAQDVEEKKSWKTAIDRAQGIKVKDDPALLKKSIKKREKLKKKSTNAWKERQESLDKRMQEKQDKRKMNIQKKKQKRKDDKIQKAKKKGRMIPGF